MSFRTMEKEMLNAKVPLSLSTKIRERAARERRSLSSVATELICLGLGRDPREFGIEPAVKPKRTAASAN